MSSHSYSGSGGKGSWSCSGNTCTYVPPNRSQRPPPPQYKQTPSAGRFQGSGTGHWSTSSSSSSSGGGGHYMSTTMTSGPDGTFSTYQSSNHPGQVFVSRQPPGPYDSPRSQRPPDRARFDANRTTYQANPYGSTATMTSCTGNGRAHVYACAGDGRECCERTDSWRWWPS